MIAQTDEALPEVEGGAAKTVRVLMAVTNSPRPMARPELGEAAETVVAGMEGGIDAALAEATAPPPPDGTLEAQVLALAEGVGADAPEIIVDDEVVELAMAEDAPKVLTLSAEVARVKPITLIEVAPVPKKRAKKAPIYDSSETETVAASASTGQEQVVLASAEAPEAEDPPMMVVARMSSSGGKHWGISLGIFGDQYAAQKVLTKTQLSQSGILGDSLRKIAKTSKGYDATFLGLTQEQAEVACGRLTAREVSCSAFGP